MLILVLAVGAVASARLGFIPRGCDGYGGYASDCDAPPVADIEMSPSNPRAGGEVRLSASMVDAGHTYDWDLDAAPDDVFEVVGADTATTTFAAGLRHVRLRVTDEHGRTAVAERIFEVHARNEKPTGGFNYDPTSPRVGQPVDFWGFADDIDGTVTSVKFDFAGDPACETAGTFEFGQVTATHAFTEGGERTVRMCITDDGGATKVVTQTIDVHVENFLPRVTLNAPETVRNGRVVSLYAFAADPDGEIAKVLWDLDGDRDNGYELDAGTDPSREAVFNDPGSIEIGVKVIDSGGGEAVDRTVIRVSDVNQLPSGAVFFQNGGPTVEINQGFTLSAFANDPDGGFAAVTLHWDIDGDDVVDFEDLAGPSTRAVPGFPTPGDRVLRVRATDGEGGSRVFTTIAHVREPNTPPSVSDIQMMGPNPISAGDVVQFSAFANDPDPGTLLFSWDLDGDPSNGFEHTPPVFAGNTVSRSFEAPGEYVIRVRVEDENGGSSEQSATVTVFDAAAESTIPTPSFSSRPFAPQTSGTINLSATHLFDAEGDNLGYAWDLNGDGDFTDMAGPAATTSFTLPGAHPVRLRVFEADENGDPVPGGLSAETTQLVDVHDGNWKPTSSLFCFGSCANPEVGQTLTISGDGMDWDGEVAQRAFDVNGNGTFDDAGVDVIDPPSGTVEVPLNQAGPLTLRVRITDNQGATSVSLLTVNVEPASGNQAPVPTIYSNTNWNLTVPVGEALTLSSIVAEPDGTPVTLSWDLDGDGVFETGNQTTATFPAQSTAGSYVVRLKASDGELEGTTAQTIQVIAGNAAPLLSGVAGPERARIDRAVSFTVFPEDPDGRVTKVEWDLDGDGEFDDFVDPESAGSGLFSSTTPPQTYAAPERTLVIGVRLTDDGGKTATATRELDIAAGNLAPTVSSSFRPTRPTAGELVTLLAIGADPDAAISDPFGPQSPEVTYAWDLNGDGEYGDAEDADLDTLGEADGATAHATFASVGTYPVGVQVRDSDDATATSRHDLVVSTERPVVNFTWSPTAPGLAAGEPVVFTSDSTDPEGTPLTYAWDFDLDGIRDFDDSTEAEPTHTFDQPGSYRVALRVTDGDGDITTKYRSVEVAGQPDPLAAIVQVTEFPTVGRPVVLEAFTSDPDNGDTAVDPESIAWDLPNGDDPAFDDATGAQVTIDDLQPGEHLVRISATDAEGRVAIAWEWIYVAGDEVAPVAFLSVFPSNPRTNREVFWEADGYDPDGGGIEAYSFDANGDGDFDDAGEGFQNSSFLTQTACAQACSMEVGLRVRDTAGQVSEPVWRTVDVHEGNDPPIVDLWADRDVAGVNGIVNLEAFAYDPDGNSGAGSGIAKYEWDFDYDPDDPQFVLGAADESHSFPEARSYLVAVKVTDEDPADPMTAIATYSIQVTDANAKPQPSIRVWPNPIVVGKDFSVSGFGNDPDGDVITTWEWDVDGVDGYDTDTNHATLTHLRFATSGPKTLRLRVTDARGETADTVIVVNAVNAPPKAIIDGPVSVEKGDTTTEFTDASDVAAGRTIVQRKWDLDNDGEWDSSAETAKVDTTTAGYRYIRLWVKDSAGETDETSRTVAVRQPSDVSPPDVIVDPALHVDVATTVNPFTGLSTITIPRGPLSGLPNQCLPLRIDFKIKKSAAAVVASAKLLLTKPDSSVLELTMTDDDGDGIHSASLPCATTGTLAVQYSFAGDATVFLVDIGGIQLIDPQGVVYDRARYDEELSKAGKTHDSATAGERTAARAAAAISGATVTLQREVEGQWVTVSENDPGIEPNINPQITPASGLYQWDVAAGTYRVKVSKPGFASVDSTSVVIPPPVLDLHIPMERNYSPTAAFDVDKDPAPRAENVKFTSTSSDIGGEIVSYAWDVDGDGFDDGDEATLNRSFTGALGDRTIKLKVTDNHGQSDVATRSLTVANKLPVANFTLPASVPRGDSATFTSSSADADGTVESYEWDFDGDGFDDGSTASVERSFTGGLGARDVRLRVTDNDSGVSAVVTKSITVTNKKPVASFTAPVSVVRSESATFTSTATDPDGTVNAYEWDIDGDGFDDGSTASIERAITGGLGSRDIRLRVTDNDSGVSDIVTKSVTVTNKSPVAGTISLNPAAPKLGQQVTLSTTGATDPDTNVPLTYAWDLDGDGFDDGTGPSVNLTPGQIQVYTVKVRVSDGDGATAVATKEFTPGAANAPPVASFTGPSQVQRGDTATFESTSTDSDGTVATYAWDVDGDGFDDGSTASIERAFAGGLGAREVRLRVTDNDGGVSEVVTKSVTVINKPPSAGTVSVSPSAPKAGQELTLTSIGASDQDTSSPVTYAWDIDGDGFDDGTGSSVKFTPADARPYTVKVQVSDADGGSSEATKELSVAPADKVEEPQPPRDTSPPALTLTAVTKQTIKKILSKGLLLTATCSEACQLKLDVFVDAKTARALKLDKRAKRKVLVGTVTLPVAAGADRAVTVKLTAKARKAFKKAKKAKLSVAATATDAALNAASKSLSVSLKAK